MTGDHDIAAARILDGITSENQLLKSLKEYCFLQGDFLKAYLFGVLFFERNPLVQPFFVWNTILDNLPILDMDKIPWKNEAVYRDTVKIDKLKMQDPVNQTIKNLTGSLLRSVVVVPLTIEKKIVGSLIMGNKSKKPVLTEGAAFLSEIASFQVTAAITKAAGQEAWARSRQMCSGILDFNINQLKKGRQNPDLIVEILLKVFSLHRILVVKSAPVEGYVFYFAEIDAGGNIVKRSQGTFKTDQYASILSKHKICRDWLSVPIIEKKEVQIGSIFLRYENHDNVFKDAMFEIVRKSAHNLAGFLSAK
jgi:hypothetical protein